jgi:hypothetical protein
MMQRVTSLSSVTHTKGCPALGAQSRTPPIALAPIGEIGYADESEFFERLPAEPPRPLENGEPLFLLSGFLDDRRDEAPLAPEHPHFALFAHVRFHQDAWNRFEHRSFWEASLDLWPAKRGNRANRYALAYAFVLARCLDVPEAAMIDGLGHTRESLRSREVFKLANLMSEELEHPTPLRSLPHKARLPRVVTEEERDHTPLIVSTSNRGSSFPASALDTLQLGIRVARDPTKTVPDARPLEGLGRGSVEIVRQAISVAQRFIADRDA